MTPVADANSITTSIATGGNNARQRVRKVCRALVIIIVACQLWVVRYCIDADGTAYVDVARSWLSGNWAHALNAYWSPLYIWLVAGALAVFSPSAHWELPLIHAIDFLGFILAFLAWEWLSSEWERWQGAAAQPMLTDIAGYCVVLWAGLRMSGIGWFNNADIIVMAVLIACTAILIRVRRMVASGKDFIILGLLLGMGFLAKTAFSVVIPAFFVALGLILRSWLDRRIALTALVTFIVIAPFVAALSIVHGRFTMGDSGRINYSWQVTGISVEGYKENAYLPGPEIRHPISVLLKDPRVLSFEQHLVGTLPVHSDVSWWCEGYPVRFNKARQLMILWSNIKFSIYAFRCPAVFLLLLCLPFAGLAIMRRFARIWFLWAPGLVLAASYCFVFSDFRYLAGSYALLGFSLIAAAWDVKLPPRLVSIGMFAIPLLTVALTMGSSFRQLPRQLIGDVTGSRMPWGYTNVQVAETMQRSGLKPGDRVAYIGFSLGAAHVGLERAQIVAMIPEQVRHDDTVSGRPLMFDFPRPHDFWRRNPADQERVFAAFRSVGAKWVFADTVPKGSDTKGWQIAGKIDEDSSKVRPHDLRDVYFRKLQD
jgi:hypothetical protein